MAKSLEERIRVLEDGKEIKELMAKYCYTMDAGDWEGVMSCYAKECSANFGHFGEGKTNTRAELEAFYRDRILKTRFHGMIHRIYNPIIEVKDETHAIGRWVLCEPMVLVETGHAAWLTCMYYVDFIKEDGKWLFKRVTDTDWRWVSDYDKGWAREPFTVPGSWFSEDIARDEERWERVSKKLERSTRY